MEDKQQMEIDGERRIKSSHLGISLIVLSLTVAASVGCLIYVNVHKAQQKQTDYLASNPVSPQYHTVSAPQQSHRTSDNQKQKKSSVKDEAVVNFKNQDGSEISEDIEYDENRDVAIFHGSDGSFLVEDFDKGINIIKDTVTGDCYVVPVGTNKTAGQELKNLVKTYRGQILNVGEQQSYTVAILPGAIEDTSFLPPEANAECRNYHWLSVIGKGNEMSQDRVKRAVCYRCYYIYYGGTLYYYCYYYYC